MRRNWKFYSRLLLGDVMRCRTACVTMMALIFIFSAAVAHSQDESQGLKWSDEKTNLTFYGVLDVGYVGRRGGNGQVADTGTQHDVQSSAGSDGSLVGLKISYALNEHVTLIGEAELGINFTGEHDAGSGGDTYYNRHTWFGAAGRWGTLLVGKVDGGRAVMMKLYDPFQGRSVAAAGALQLLTTRAEETVYYATPSWAGFTLGLAYTSNVYGVDDADSRSPVYAVNLAYKRGPLALSWEHEEEWWNSVPGFTRMKLDMFAGTYDFSVLKLFALYERIRVDAPVADALSYYHDHKGYLLGVTVPMGENGLWKVSWNRRDSAYVDNGCDKWGVGYQHSLDSRVYLYADYARIDNDRGGTCTIAYNNEQTSADLGRGDDAGGYGIEGVDFGLVFKF